MVKSVGSFCVKADIVCDYIPVLSTGSNLINLFQKYVVLPFMGQKNIGNSHYFTYLKQKSILRCAILLIPIVGNILIAIYDYKNKKQSNKESAHNALIGVASFQQIGGDLKNNKEFVLSAIKQGFKGFEFVSDNLKNDRDVVLAAVSTDPDALQFASKTLKEDRGVVLAAVRKNGEALKYAIDTFTDDKEIVLTAVKNYGQALAFASRKLKEDREVVCAAMDNNFSAIRYTPQTLQEGFISYWTREKSREITRKTSQA